MGLRELLREGAADLVGVGDELADLREARTAALAMTRRLEDIDWPSLLRNDSGAYFDPDREQQIEQTKRAYKYFFNDPIVKRTVLLRSYYTFGRGMPEPKYRDNMDADPDDEVLGSAYIERFWHDPDNQEALTRHAIQLQRDIEVQLQGQHFLGLYRSDEKAPQVMPTDPRGIAAGADGRRRPSTLKITVLPESEFVDIIMHPDNATVPVYYKRQYRERTYRFDFNQGHGGYEDGQLVTRYYRHWRNEAPTSYRGKDWGPPAAQVDDARVYHIVVNRAGGMKFGITELQSYLKWAKGLNEYMTARMSFVQAIAQIAMQAKTRGGAKNVQQVASALQDITKYSGVVEGSEKLKRDPAEQGRTKVAVSNAGAELQPMVTDTNAGGAQNDISTMRGHMAAGSGVPEHHLGGPGSNLASATSMDAPLLRMIQANQELWETVHRDLVGYMIEGVGLDPARVEVQMPPILERDVSAVVTQLTSLISTLDPQISNKEFMRFVLTETLDAMGKVNTKEIVEQILPDVQKTPFQLSQELAQINALAADPDAQAPEAAGAQEDGDSTSPSQRAARGQRARDAEDEAARNQGRRRGPTGPFGPGGMGAAARDRAARRRELALEGLVEGSGEVDWADLLPAELQEAGERALAAFDEAFAEDGS